MSRARLNPQLVSKIAKKKGIKESSVQQGASRRAGKLGVPTEVALIVWASELGISTTGALNKLPSDLQAQLQNVMPVAALLTKAASPDTRSFRGRESKQASVLNERAVMRAVLPHVLSHQTLRDRCTDLLVGRGPFDRVLSQCTTVLEATLRKRSHLSKRKAKNTQVMISRALHQDKALLRVSEDDDEQEGFYSLVKGTFLVVRNATHHELTDKLTRWDALRLCCFVDYLLTEIEEAELSPPGGS